MKKFPSSIDQDRNNDNNTIKNTIICNNKQQQHKNVIELPDVWKRTNSYILNKSSSKPSPSPSNIIKEKEFKLSFDIFPSNQRNNNIGQLSSLANINKGENNKAMAFAELGLRFSRIIAKEQTFIEANRTSSSSKLFQKSKIGKISSWKLNRHENSLLDVGVTGGGFEYWDGSTPNV